mgnify:CR=1 FL=1
MMRTREAEVSARAIHAHVAAAEPVAGRAGMGVVFVDTHGRVLRRIGRMLPGVATRELAAFRGILYALWNSRRLGSRWVVVHSDNPDVVAQINGVLDVDPALVGPYLEVRALLHAYRGARVEAGETIMGREAAAVAQAAIEHDTDDIVEDLPLWAGQPSLVQTPA